MGELIGFPQELAALRTSLRRARQHGEAWPMLIVDDVLKVGDMWDLPSIQMVVHGQTFTSWLQSDEGGGLGRNWTAAAFLRVRKVVDALGGESCRRTWIWKAAQWVYNQCTTAEIAIVVQEYPRWKRETNNGAPLSVGQVRKHVREMRRLAAMQAAR